MSVCWICREITLHTTSQEGGAALTVVSVTRHIREGPAQSLPSDDFVFCLTTTRYPRVSPRAAAARVTDAVATARAADSTNAIFLVSAPWIADLRRWCNRTCRQSASDNRRRCRACVNNWRAAAWFGVIVQQSELWRARLKLVFM